MRIVNCKMNHLANPIGYQMDKLMASWQVEDAVGKKAAEAQIQVAADEGFSEIIYDTGIMKEFSQLGVALPISAEPRTRYYWRVRVTSDTGETGVSDAQFFETGKREEAWSGRWISCEKRARHPIFQKDICIGKTVSRARLYICGLGLYEAALNGMRVGDEYLTPYCNNYNAWKQYQTYDVTASLKTGENMLSVMLAPGWYAGRMGYFSKPGDSGHYGTDDRLIAELHIDYADGSHEVVATDDTWRVTRSNITASSIYDGESRDDTLEPTAWEACHYVEEKAPLTERYSIPVRIQETFRPVGLIHTPAGEWVYDLGQNITGIFSLHVKAERGAKIHVQVGEVLQDGNFYNENLRTALAEYNYISDGVEKDITPAFTFYGYRYVKVEGIEEPKPEDLTGLAIYSDLPKTGTLTTGHDKINRLIKNVEYGQKGNFVDVPTDCPQRDERLGWTGDAQVFSATSCFLRDSYAFYRKYLHDMKTEQDENQGMVPDVIPSFAPEYRGTASVWGDAACIIPWNVYQFYGDVSILEECYEGMKDWVDFVRGIDQDRHLWKNCFHYGDWLALDHPSKKDDTCMGGTYEGFIAETYYYNSTSIVRRTAEILGRTEDAAHYKKLEDWLLSGLQDEYFTKNGRCAVDTQTGILLGLRYQLIPEKKNMRMRLLQKLKQNEGNLQTGFVGTPFLLGQLTEAGYPHLAYGLLLNENYPGWLYEVNLGATTIWERWNSLNPDGTISSTGMNSLNHYSYGAVLEWLCRYAAGLNQASEGFGKAVIRPYPDVRLGKLDYTYEAAAGTYRVAWRIISDSEWELEVTIPFGCEADLYLPEARDGSYGTEEGRGIHVEAGTFRYCYETAEPMRSCYHVTDPLRDVIFNDEARALLDEYLTGMTGLPDSMRWQSIEELAEDPRVRRLSEREKEEFQAKLMEIMV